ncbi:hypothetical protein, conserved [Plasmodium gonderi]|uniref:Uncharacterized protein n=1 Tax=Plasmodium gonderi TaxID=77519 RepID=A0A1Y1JV17_PLAGO|nr:hypothetical protein, conserved [Plasmodium gonderi]GAW83754.1 hypothetical protein, conserved [Plasmodium gonderi]
MSKGLTKLLEISIFIGGFLLIWYCTGEKMFRRRKEIVKENILLILRHLCLEIYKVLNETSKTTKSVYDMIKNEPNTVIELNKLEEVLLNNGYKEKIEEAEKEVLKKFQVSVEDFYEELKNYEKDEQVQKYLNSIKKMYNEALLGIQPKLPSIDENISQDVIINLTSLIYKEKRKIYKAKIDSMIKNNQDFNLNTTFSNSEFFNKLQKSTEHVEEKVIKENSNLVPNLFTFKYLVNYYSDDINFIQKKKYLESKHGEKMIKILKVKKNKKKKKTTKDDDFSNNAFKRTPSKNSLTEDNTSSDRNCFIATPTKQDVTDNNDVYAVSSDISADNNENIMHSYLEHMPSLHHPEDHFMQNVDQNQFEHDPQEVEPIIIHFQQNAQSAKKVAIASHSGDEENLESFYSSSKVENKKNPNDESLFHNVQKDLNVNNIKFENNLEQLDTEYGEDDEAKTDKEQKNDNSQQITFQDWEKTQDICNNRFYEKDIENVQIDQAQHLTNHSEIKKINNNQETKYDAENDGGCDMNEEIPENEPNSIPNEQSDEGRHVKIPPPQQHDITIPSDLSDEKSRETEEVPEEVKSGEALEEVKSGEALEEVKSGEALEEVKSGEALEEVKSGEALEEVKSGEALEEVKSGEALEEVKSGEALEEVKTGDVSEEIKTGDVSEEIKTGDVFEEVKSGEVLEEIKTGDVSEEIKTGDVSEEVKSGEVLEEVKSGEMLEVKCEVSEEIKTGDVSEEVKSGEVLEEIKTGDVSEEIKTGDVSEEIKTGDVSEEVKSGEVLKVKKEELKEEPLKEDPTEGNKHLAMKHTSKKKKSGHKDSKKKKKKKKKKSGKKNSKKKKKIFEKKKKKKKKK